MTAEERREKEIAETKEAKRWAEIAAIVGVDKLAVGDQVPQRSINQWLKHIEAAYEAGRSSMQSEAARKTDSLAGECTAINDLHGHECEIDCEAVKELAAAIRALKV